MYNSKQTTQISKANSKRVECFVVTDWNLYFDMKVQNIFYISQYGRRILVCMQNVCFYRSFCAQSLNTDLLYLLLVILHFLLITQMSTKHYVCEVLFIMRFFATNLSIYLFIKYIEKKNDIVSSPNLVV